MTMSRTTMFEKVLDEYVAASGRKFKGREKTVGASEVGQCLRKVWYVKNRTAPDSGHVDAWGARVRGTLHEDKFLVPALRRKFKGKLLYAGTQQHTWSSGFLSATPDGLLVDQAKNFLAEHF